MSAPSALYSRTPLVTDWSQRYQIVRKIGAGGFAEVFEAIDLKLDRNVALKVIDERGGVSSRVLREVEAAASLSHPGIVSLFDFFSDGRRSFIVWELVRGRSLAEVAGELTDADAVEAVAQVLDALAYAHEQRVVHRDIKPQNIMVADDGHVKVMDFGIARLLDAETLTSDGDMLGTVAYMSPEQAAGRRAGPPSDVYSTAIVLYELLCGANPVRGATPAETISNVVAGRIPSLGERRPDLPLDLIDAVDVAVLHDPAERPSAQELSDALRAVAGRLGGRHLRPQRVLHPLARGLRRAAPLLERVAGAALAAGVLLALLPRLSGYPQSWTLPLSVLTLALWLVLPTGGLAWLLGVLAFPVFNVSLGLGVAYVALALVISLIAARRPVVAVFPALAIFALPFAGALLVPAAAALFGRLRGFLVAAWSGLVIVTYVLITGISPSPFTGFQPRSHLAAHLAGDNPITVALRVVRAVATAPGLGQVVIWGIFALAIHTTFQAHRLERRLWLWSVSCAGLFAGEWVLPAHLWHYRASLATLLPSVAMVAAVLLVLVFLAGEERAA